MIVHVTELVGGKGGTYPLAADDDDFKARIQAQAEKLRTEGVQADVPRDQAPQVTFLFGGCGVGFVT